MSEDPLAFLAARPLGVIATAGRDGPHAVPVEVLVRGGLVYVWCHADSVKAHNIRRSGRAALTAYKGQRGVLVRGSARLVAAGEPGYDAVTGAFLAKYEREEAFGNDCLIELTPERVVEWD